MLAARPIRLAVLFVLAGALLPALLRADAEDAPASPRPPVAEEESDKAAEIEARLIEDGAKEQTPAEPADAEDEDAAPQRVILRVSRHRQVAGHVELEDADVIVIRTLRGEVESFSKSRLLKIVRLVEPAPGQRGTVYLHDGQERDGIILEDTFDHVTIEIEGIRTRLPRSIVDEVELAPTFEERYEHLVSLLRPGVHEQHVLLSRWLIEHRRYDLAREHLLAILDDAEVSEARRLLRTVEAQLRLQEQGRARRKGASAEDDASAGDDVAPPPRVLLSRDDVNLVRVYEIDFDNPPRVQVEPETIRALLSAYSTSPLLPESATDRNRLFRVDSIDVVRLMFELRARDLYPEIRVLSEPRSMNLFRQRVHDSWLLNNCATSGCHGGPEAGDFMLYRDGYRNERVRYTNFLILERLEIDPAWPMINYEEPEMSLIVQYGLPRDRARLPHPEVRGWRPAFHRGAERLKGETVRWIESMMQPRPAYPVEFDPPRPRTASLAAVAVEEKTDAAAKKQPASED